MINTDYKKYLNEQIMLSIKALEKKKAFLKAKKININPEVLMCDYIII